MKGPPVGPGGEDITWPDQVAPRGRKASSSRKIIPQTSNPIVRALPPKPDFSTLFSVTLIVLDLNIASMLHQIQSPNFLQVPLVTPGHKTQTNPVGTPLTVKNKHLINKTE